MTEDTGVDTADAADASDAADGAMADTAADDVIVGANAASWATLLAFSLASGDSDGCSYFDAFFCSKKRRGVTSVKSKLK